MTPDMSVWHGRTDEFDGPLAQRWHQLVKPLTPGCHPGIALIGFACDEGVRRNGGRVGAKSGPQTIRSALANLAWHQNDPVYDAGNVACDDGDLAEAQARLGERIESIIHAGHRPLILGGGHEIAWGTHMGLTAAKPRTPFGIINFDAHFDLRADPEPNSGTPFHQIAECYADRNEPFRYLVLGIAVPANTAALFHRADRLGVHWHRDRDLTPGNLESIRAAVRQFIQPCERIHLSIDLDVLPAAEMPAVSAPAARGVPLEIIELLTDTILDSGKTAAVEVVELNPAYDIDQRGARVAARLVWHIASQWRASP